MSVRLRLFALVFVALLGLAVVAERQSVPITQIDVFARSDVAPVLNALDPAQTVADALGELPPARRQAFAVLPPGAAFAGAPAFSHAMNAVTLEAVAPRRLRIRIASADEGAAQLVAGRLHASLAEAGLKERFSISSASSGSIAPLFAWAASLVAGVVVGGLLVARLAGRSRRRLPVSPLRGAASTG